MAGTAENPLFCLADVCKAVGLSNPSTVKTRLDKEDVQLIDLHTLNTKDPIIFGNTLTNFVTESGFYDVILQSSSSKVKPFRKWITSEVLPSIRKNGGYITSKNDMTDEEIMAKALNIANETIKRRNERIIALESENKQLAEQNAVMLPKVRSYEQVINTPQTEWLKTTQQVANEIGMSANKLNKLLIAAGIIYKAQNGEYLVTANYAGWNLHCIVSYPISENRIKTYIKWTERGRLYIHALNDCNWNKRKAFHFIKEGRKEVAS